MRADVLNKNSGSYGNVPDFYPNGFSAKTAGFTAEAGYIYLVTDLDGCAIVLPTPTYGARIKIVIGTTTGNGGVIELVGLSASRWKIEATLYASGTIATPFS